jgi:ribulose-phosphate 3-epimerase
VEIAMPLIAPSILSADFGRISDEVAAATAAGADWIHVDVMDGHFVPSITIGPLVTRAVREATAIPLDVHLMVEEPERHVAAFVDVGANRLTIHVEAEACDDPGSILRTIRDAGARAGLAINPETPLDAAEPFLNDIDLLLVMTVHPGKGGQKIEPDYQERIATACRMRQAAGASFLVEVDGGIKAFNAAHAVAAGADVLVAGSAIFESQDYAAAIRALRGG